MSSSVEVIRAFSIFLKIYVSFGVCINIPFITSLVLPQNVLAFGRHLMFSIPSVQSNTTTELRPI